MSSNSCGDETKRRVLSIQSHVVHGYVGNKSATFPLQVSFKMICLFFCIYLKFSMKKGFRF